MKPGAVILAGLTALCAVASAAAQPAGPGWVAVATAAPGTEFQASIPWPVGADVVNLALCAGAECVSSQTFSEPVESYPVWFPGAWWDEALQTEVPREVVMYQRARTFESLDAAEAQARRIADLGQLWGLAVVALAAIWAVRQFILRLVMNQ